MCAVTHVINVCVRHATFLVTNNDPPPPMVAVGATLTPSSRRVFRHFREFDVDRPDVAGALIRYLSEEITANHAKVFHRRQKTRLFTCFNCGSACKHGRIAGGVVRPALISACLFDVEALAWCSGWTTNGSKASPLEKSAMQKVSRIVSNCTNMIIRTGTKSTILNFNLCC